jgi:hypothetical protein
LLSNKKIIESKNKIDILNFNKYCLKIFDSKKRIYNIFLLILEIKGIKINESNRNELSIANEMF